MINESTDTLGIIGKLLAADGSPEGQETKRLLKELDLSGTSIEALRQGYRGLAQALCLNTTTATVEAAAEALLSALAQEMMARDAKATTEFLLSVGATKDDNNLH